MPNRFSFNLKAHLYLANLNIILILFVTATAGNITAFIVPGNTTAVWTGNPFNLQFPCDVQSSEIPSILWTFTNITSKRTFQISSATGSLDSRYSVTFPNQRNSILIINNVQLKNNGVYTCLATIGQLSSQASSTLSIQGTMTSDSIIISYHFNFTIILFNDAVAPSMPVITGHINYNESDVAILECKVITFPSPTITWIKRDHSFADY